MPVSHNPCVCGSSVFCWTEYWYYIYCQKGPTAAVLSKKVEIVWFDHTDHAHLLQSYSQECPEIFNHRWFGSITVGEKLRLNRVVKTASKIIGRYLPSLESLYQQHLLGRASLLSQDSPHPAHDLFDPLPSSRRFRSIKNRTSRFSSSFSPLAVQTLSKQKRFFSHL